MGKLRDLNVERVDGVDKPAIRKRWVLVKSEQTPTEVEKDFAGAARNVIEALQKEETLSFSDETVEVLRALVELLELDGVEFAAKSEDDAEAADEAADESDEAEGDADENEVVEGEDPTGAEGDVEKTYTAEQVEELLAKALAANGVTVEEVEKGEVSTLRPRSRQPQGQDGPTGTQVKKGEGLFTNIVFADATKLGSK